MYVDNYKVIVCLFYSAVYVELMAGHYHLDKTLVINQHIPKLYIRSYQGQSVIVVRAT